LPLIALVQIGFLVQLGSQNVHFGTKNVQTGKEVHIGYLKVQTGIGLSKMGKFINEEN
jgi:hypothetical protein